MTARRSAGPGSAELPAIDLYLGSAIGGSDPGLPLLRSMSASFDDRTAIFKVSAKLDDPTVGIPHRVAE